jgi:uncharacterized phage protein (TIGR01671 family)
MREIKFRAWDDTLLKMWEPLTLEQIAKGNFTSTNWYQLHIMQYTGLKDKNGVEIYEGDIVDNGYTIIYSFNSKREFRYVGIVRYDVKNGCLVINNIDGQSKRLTQKTIDKTLTVKVIGNIHDNPELLKG